MRQRILIYYPLLVFLLGILGACSTEKNTPITRTYHNVTSRYNIFFNGNESYKRGIEKMKDTHEDDFTLILPIFEYVEYRTATTIAPDMDRAIQKATKVITLHSITAKPEFKDGPQSPKQKALYAQNEYNKFVPGNYLIMGKAYFLRHDFHLALETFKFIMTEYHYDDITYETQIWIARTHNELKEYDEAEDILEVLTGTTEFPQKLNADLYATLADLYMKQEEYDRAIEPLRRAVEYVTGKDEKVRWSFILAQLHQEAGDHELASDYYQDVIKMNPDYQMSFNARINRASVFVAGSDNAKEIKDELQKMLKDAKNADFRDQIYYALGNVYFREGDINEALNQYKNSSIYNISNIKQKATTCLTIANIYYDSQDYTQSDFYFDTAMVSLTTDYPDYEVIAAKTRNLSVLVENLQIIQLEDSLQMLADLPESQRLAIIDSIISQVQREEEIARKQEMDGMRDQQFNRMALNESQRSGFSNSGEKEGKWYFYNQAAKGFGQPEFRMKWGNRQLEDFWRRSNKSEVTFTTTDEEGEVSDTTGVIEEATKIFSNKSREFYLREIPLTDSLKEISDARIEEGLYNAGTIYKNDLRDYPKSEETYLELLDRFPGTQYTLRAYYNLYSQYNEENNIASANLYKSLIVRDFPESQPAQILTNPNYVAELLAKENEVNYFYQQTYDMYQRGDYFGVMINADTAYARYPDDPTIPKFQFLQVLAIGKTMDIFVFTQALDSLSIISTDPEVVERATAILTHIMDTDEEVKTETEKTEAEEIYQADSTGTFSFGLFVDGNVDINQLKFEFINLNLDLYPNKTYDVVHEELNGGVIGVYVKQFPSMEEAWEYYDHAFRAQKVFEVLEGAQYRLFIISTGNGGALSRDGVANKYWLFFQKHYIRNEGDTDTLDG
ncbi:tetratricopeptide repeat protein [Bacteroidota bacterium]